MCVVFAKIDFERKLISFSHFVYVISRLAERLNQNKIQHRIEVTITRKHNYKFKMNRSHNYKHNIFLL